MWAGKEGKKADLFNSILNYYFKTVYCMTFKIKTTTIKENCDHKKSSWLKEKCRKGEGR